LKDIVLIAANVKKKRIGGGIREEKNIFKYCVEY